MGDLIQVLLPLFTEGVVAGPFVVGMIGLVWMVRRAEAREARLYMLTERLINLQEKTNQIVAESTEASHEVARLQRDTVKIVREILNKILARPCIASREEGGGR